MDEFVAMPVRLPVVGGGVTYPVPTGSPLTSNQHQLLLLKLPQSALYPPTQHPCKPAAPPKGSFMVQIPLSFEVGMQLPSLALFAVLTL